MNHLFVSIILFFYLSILLPLPLALEKQQVEQRNRFMLIAFGFILALVLMLITTGIIFTLRRHWRRKKAYEQDITSLRDQYDAISRQYQNMVTGMMQESKGLAEGDKVFLKDLVMPEGVELDMDGLEESVVTVEVPEEAPAAETGTDANPADVPATAEKDDAEA